MAVLELERVTKSFKQGFIPKRQTVVHDLGFSVEAGEIFGFLGPNGAGKTTTIKLIVSLLFPDEGRIRINGRDACESAARRSLGYLPENPYFYDYLTGAEFLDFYGRLFGLDLEERRKRASVLLERLSLARAAKTPLRRYSKGMVQRLGFAQALIARPTLIVLDEPMSGLDPIGRRDFRDLILEERQRGATVFFSSHILQDAEAICDRVAILVDGRLRSVGRLGDLMTDAGSGYEVGIEGVEPERVAPPARVVARSEAHLLIHTSTLSEAEAAIELLEAAGGRLVSLVPTRATLEDLFLREIEKGESS